MKYNDFSTTCWKGRIQAVYVDEKNLVVNIFGEGWNEEQFCDWDYFQPEQFHESFSMQLDNYFKIHTAENGWSDEDLIPKEGSTISNKELWQIPSLPLWLTMSILARTRFQSLYKLHWSKNENTNYYFSLYPLK